MRLRKETIKKVLATEPLAPGNWRFPETLENGEYDFDGCRVCAVGAIVRHALKKKARREEPYSFNELCVGATQGVYMQGDDKEIKEVLAMGNYLGALSMYFESKAHGYENSGKPVSKRVRNNLIKFVDKNFPSTIEVII